MCIKQVVSVFGVLILGLGLLSMCCLNGAVSAGEEGLVAYWSFDDGKEDTAKDLSRNGNDGKIMEATSVKGKVSNALKFSGEECYIEIDKPPSLDPTDKPLTVMAWINSEAKNGVVVARGGSYRGYSLYLKDGVPNFAMRTTQGEEIMPIYLASGISNVVGRWVHIAGVLREDGIEIYVNGKFEGKGEIQGYISNEPGDTMQIGWDKFEQAQADVAEITDYFKGIIDEVKVYHRALSSDEILAQFKAAK